MYVLYVLRMLITEPGRRVACDPSAHLGVMKRTTGAPMTGFARTSQH
jgi:hypothetical protein